MKNRLLTLCLVAIGASSLANSSSAAAEQAEAPQGIEAPSAYLESIETPGDSGGVEDADPAAAAQAEQAAEKAKSGNSQKDG